MKNIKEPPVQLEYGLFEMHASDWILLSRFPTKELADGARRRLVTQQTELLNLNRYQAFLRGEAVQAKTTRLRAGRRWIVRGIAK